jgi:teichuronic acid biosynthesis glycosyltransferase TuaG
MTSFSVIIPTFNSDVTIESAIYSCLNQSLAPYEVIVIDDCSTDSTVQRVKDIMRRSESKTFVRLLSTRTNSGPATARNLGWNSASGDYIAFLDSDDLWHPKKLECINTVLTKYKQIQILGHCNSILRESIYLRRVLKSSLLVKNFSITPNLIFNKAIKERFDETMRYTEDHDLLLRIAKYYPIYHLNGANIPTILGRPPMTAGGLSGNRFRMRVGELYMYKKFLTRDIFSFLYLPLVVMIFFSKLIMEIFRFINKRV